MLAIKSPIFYFHVLMQCREINEIGHNKKTEARAPVFLINSVYLQVKNQLGKQPHTIKTHLLRIKGAA